MYPLFFITNHSNYARYMVRYHLNLLNMDEMYPGARSVLESCGLSVRRSDKTFCGTPVDLTLEQTINADAASRFTGIAAFTNSIQARKRWFLTRSMRTSVLSHLFKLPGLNQNEDAVKELRHHQIERDNCDLDKIIQIIKNMRNPFDQKLEKNELYCLSTGRATSNETASELLHCLELGNKYTETFKAECFENSLRFVKPIARRKVKNFSGNAIKTKIKVKDNTIKELKGTRDLFGRLLFLAAQNKVDLSVVFQ